MQLLARYPRIPRGPSSAGALLVWMVASGVTNAALFGGGSDWLFLGVAALLVARGIWVLFGVEPRLRPGADSGLGFLGEKESLTKVIERDDRVLWELDLDHAEVAAALEQLVHAVKEERNIRYAKAKELGREFLIEFFTRHHSPWFDPYDMESLSKLSFASLPSEDQGYLFGRHQVFVTGYRGLQHCPWGCKLDSTDSSQNFLVLDRDTGNFFTFPGLSPHLIRVHHFFEGLKTPFRTDPSRVAQVLGLAMVDVEDR